MTRWLITLLMLALCTGVQESRAVPAYTSDADSPSDAQATAARPRRYDKALVVCFSRTGYTRQIAGVIREVAGGDTAELRTTVPYPDSYQDVLAQSRKEIDADYCPPLSTRIGELASYDLIFIGYPIWFGTFPPPIRTFLTQCNLTGKTVVPFCTSGSSDGEPSFRELQRLIPGATVLPGLQVRSSAVESSRHAVEKWLRQIGITD